MNRIEDGTLTTHGPENEGFVMVQHDDSGIYLTVSLRANGDAQVRLSREEVEKFVDMLQTSIS